MTSPLVSIGLPTYNRPAGLRKALNCLLSQSYRNIELMISDNCSPNPEVEALGREIAIRDSRVHYVRQESNIGALNNFRYVYEKARGEFFMWAADDDEWDEDFIQICMMALLGDPEVVLSFCHVRQKDPETGMIVDEHFSDKVGSLSASPLRRSIRYLLWSGSNNCFYGIYRKHVINPTFFSRRFGSDHLAILSILNVGKLSIHDRSLYTYALYGRGFQRAHFHQFYDDRRMKIMVTLSSTLVWFWEFLAFIWSYHPYSWHQRAILTIFLVLRFLRWKYWRRLAGDLRALITRRDIWKFLE